MMPSFWMRGLLGGLLWLGIGWHLPGGDLEVSAGSDLHHSDPRSAGLQPHLDREVDLPKGPIQSVTLPSALAAVASQFPFAVVLALDPAAQNRPFEISSNQLESVLEAVGRTTKTTWSRTDTDLVFRMPPAPEPILRLLRQQGSMRPLDEAQAAHTFLRALNHSQLDDLTADGFLPWERLTADQRERFVALPVTRPLPQIKDVPLAQLPEKDLVLLAGFFLRVQVEAAPGMSYETSGRIEAMALYAGESVGAVERIQPAAEIVRDLAEGAERVLRERLA
jgi:hypothetical protein